LEGNIWDLLISHVAVEDTVEDVLMGTDA